MNYIDRKFKISTWTIPIVARNKDKQTIKIPLASSRKNCTILLLRKRLHHNLNLQFLLFHCSLSICHVFGQERRMCRDNMEELRMKKKERKKERKEKVKRKNDSRLVFSNKKKKKKKENNRERISLVGLISRSLTFERNSMQIAIQLRYQEFNFDLDEAAFNCTWCFVSRSLVDAK